MKPREKLIIDDREIEKPPYLGIGGDDTPLPDVEVSAEDIEQMLALLFPESEEDESE